MKPSEFASEISKKTGLTFKQSHSGSSSFYCNERRIRISDHFSKFVERSIAIYGDEDAIDLVCNLKPFDATDIDFALKLINKQDFFNELKEGVKISHIRSDLVGEIDYISHCVEKQTVKVLKKNENRIVDYYFEKISIEK